jgi:hypothetical protein
MVQLPQNPGGKHGWYALKLLQSENLSFAKSENALAELNRTAPAAPIIVDAAATGYYPPPPTATACPPEHRGARASATATGKRSNTKSL